MKAPKHTPGPWKNRTGNVYFMKLGKLFIGNLILVNEYQENEKWLATVWQNENVDEQDANAQLISAAPDLLDALELIRSWELGKVTDKTYEEVWDIAHKAIVKARSKTCII